jgi:hypothetical protein
MCLTLKEIFGKMTFLGIFEISCGGCRRNELMFNKKNKDTVS